MTSNTTPYGVASASSEFSSKLLAYKAFDGNTTDTDNRWTGSFNSETYIQYKFNNPVCIKKFSYQQEPTNYEFTEDTWYDATIKLSISNDGTNWTHIGTYQTLASKSKQMVYEEVSNTTFASYVRITFISNNLLGGGAKYACLAGLQFYDQHS